MDLREARFRKRLTQYDLAIRSSLHQSRISLIENGYVRPSQNEATKLANALGLNLEELEFGNEGMGKNQSRG